jgi:hypothetical protein
MRESGVICAATMSYLVQRLIINSYAWTKPSPGRLGPAGEGKYVQENGFGHEDWNFNYEFAIDEHIYGYAYYEPGPAKKTELFQFAFVIYQSSKWYLVGFYLDATFAPEGAQRDKSVINEKMRHLLELKRWNSLGTSWTRLSEEAIVRKLEDGARWIRWKVNVNKAIRLPQPIEIPNRIYNSRNYHLTKPKEINATTFSALRRLASDAVLPDEDDETTFPEGRELFLRHRARERNPRLIDLAKARFLRTHGKLFCQACDFDFERTYGELGRGFIEAHHTIPVSELSSGSTTKVNDIALVCSNCHRMLHRKRPWLALSELKTVLR